MTEGLAGLEGHLIIETERLYARPWHPEDDVDAVIRIYGHPEVMHFIGDGLVDTPEAARQMLNFVIERTRAFGGDYGSWALIERASDELVGCVLLKPLPGKKPALTEHIEVGWHLARHMWGRGYATEAGRAMLARAFGELGLERVVAVTEPENLGSLGVMKRLGMRHVGQSKDYYDGLLLELYESFSAG